jgi:hypothetical protein
MAYFESAVPVEIGPLQDQPKNPFSGNLTIGVNIVLNEEGVLCDLESSKIELSEEQIALLGKFASLSRNHALSNNRIATESKSLHKLRVRNGTKNLPSFTHIDNRESLGGFFQQIETYGADGQYVFVTGRNAPICLRGEYTAPPFLPGLVTPFYLALAQRRKIKEAAQYELKQDVMYQLGYSTVHTAPRNNDTGLFIGGYVS